ncbi:MAG: hypothetical protein DRI71_08735 [Bacteroidetes bacterium]|nr:MAG: hypothetical protein DRI71_08735 [Bacteroidota bacterium]
MKKTGILLVVLIISASAMAQQGSWYVGGQFGFGSQKSTNFNNNRISKITVANISPEVGMFITDDITVGVAVNFSSEKDNNDIADTDYDKLVLTSPVIYARKFWSIEDIFSAFVGLDFNFSTGNYKENRNDVLTTLDKVSGFGVNLNVGIAYPLGERFTAVGKYGLVGYSSTTLKDDAGTKQRTDSEFGFNVNTLGSLFNIGLYYTFLKK